MPGVADIFIHTEPRLDVTCPNPRPSIQPVGPGTDPDRELPAAGPARGLSLKGRYGRVPGKNVAKARESVAVKSEHGSDRLHGKKPKRVFR